MVILLSFLIFVDGHGLGHFFVKAFFADTVTNGLMDFLLGRKYEFLPAHRDMAPTTFNFYFQNCYLLKQKTPPGRLRAA